MAAIEAEELTRIFQVGGEEVRALDGLTVSLERGSLAAVVGPSGSGKSTILNLIPRLYQKTSGDILIDGQSIYSSTVKSLRKNISLVSQDTTLFDDTIKNNIRYANFNASQKEIEDLNQEGIKTDEFPWIEDKEN